MKILFVWTGLTSYMGDCWRKLAACDGIELKVVADVTGASAKAVDFTAEKVLRGLDHTLVTDAASLDRNGWTFRPDVIFAVGWHSPVCRWFVEDKRFAGIPKICCFDMPWRWKLRCLVAPLVLGRFLRRYDAAFVPGAVCSRYAKWLGFRRIFTGLFSLDTVRFGEGMRDEGRGTRDEVRYFLYIGRNSAEKRLDDLRAAHALYVKRGGTLPLRMYGKGLDGGFITPEEVPALMRGAAAFVLASDFDPWPLVLLEAMSAGCPVIASDRCTNRPELGKNWSVFKVGDVGALAELMKRAEGGLRQDVRENLELARQYDCARWVERVEHIVKEVQK